MKIPEKASITLKDAPDIRLGVKRTEYGWQFGIFSDDAELLLTLFDKNTPDAGVNTVDEDRSLGIVYCDVTGLKKVNDTEGHEMGDRLLKNACESLQRVFSGYGLFRIGGDEFLAVANGVTREALDERVGLLKEDMKQHDVNMAIGEVWTHKAPRNPDALLTEAEKQMYQDKAEYYQRAGIDRRRY